jgi:hypothetical protein
LALLRVAIAGLGVGERQGLEEHVEIGPGDAVWLSLVEVAAHADVPVGPGEDRLGLAEQLRAQLGLDDRPRIHEEDAGR